VSHSLGFFPPGFILFTFKALSAILAWLEELSKAKTATAPG